VNLRQALGFIRKHGVVLQSAHGAVPTLVDAIVGERVRGSWWAHAQGRAIFQLLGAIYDSKQVLPCRLVDGKLTLVHRRLWPALVRLAPVLGSERLAEVRQEHTASGAHRTVTRPFPRWVPPAVRQAGAALAESEARAQLAAIL